MKAGDDRHPRSSRLRAGVRTLRFLLLALALTALLALATAAPALAEPEPEAAPDAAAVSSEDPIVQDTTSSAEAGADDTSVADQASEQAQEASGEQVSTADPAPDPSPDPAQGGGGNAAADSGGGSQASSTSSQTADAAAGSTQDQPSNVNNSVRHDQPGDIGDVTQSNTSSASASAANTVNIPAGGFPSGSAAPGVIDGSTQSASAGADANQNGATNVNVSVLVDSPGNIGAVTQTNTASADGTAANSATFGAAADPLATDGGQTAGATATANQSDPLNLNVSVRVDSPGDNGAVTQTNTASAAASSESLATFADAVATLADQLDDAANEADDRQTEKLLEGAADTFADGADELEDIAADTSEASASQSGGTNVNLSVRVNSDGENGDVTQENSASATENGLEGTIVQTDGRNADISIRIEDENLVADLTIWHWTWTLVWDGVTPLDLGALYDSIVGWDWDMGVPETGGSATTISLVTVGSTPEGAAAEATATEAPPPGTWIWNWDFAWGDWALDFNWNELAPCATCTWIWDWNWVLGAPAEPVLEQDTAAETAAETVVVPAETSVVLAIGEEEPGEAAQVVEVASAPPVVQTNSAAAVAEAINIVELTGQAPDAYQAGESSEQAQALGQEIEVTQAATAGSLAAQADPLNHSVTIDTAVQQQNLVEAAALAGNYATGEQVAQAAQAGAGAEQEQGAGQGITIAQTSTAIAVADQQEAVNEARADGGTVTQTNAAVAEAGATTESWVGQTVVQGQAGEESIQEQSSEQLVEITQIATAAAVTTQASVRNQSTSRKTEVVQANGASAAALTELYVDAVQEVAQVQAGSESIQSQLAVQYGLFLQHLFAGADATQLDAMNSNLSVNGHVSQANTSTAVALATAVSISLQTIFQGQVGVGVAQLQEALQLLVVTQTGEALGSAEQDGVENFNISFIADAVEDGGDTVWPPADGGSGSPSPYGYLGLLEPSGEGEDLPLLPGSRLPGAITGGLDLLWLEVDPFKPVVITTPRPQISVSIDDGQSGTAARYWQAALGPKAQDTERAGRDGNTRPELLRPCAPQICGATSAAGIAGAHSTGGPVAATADPVTVGVPGLAELLSSPTVRRSAVFQLLEEHPG
jgi:hypothetical protein